MNEWMNERLFRLHHYGCEWGGTQGQRLNNGIPNGVQRQSHDKPKDERLQNILNHFCNASH